MRNRSEAVRDLARLGLERAWNAKDAAGECVATLSYVFDHRTRQLAKRLTATHHAHHELQVATLHVHLDRKKCLEVAVLRGAAAAVREFAQAVIAERGVAHGRVTFVPVIIETATHTHEGGLPTSEHLLVHPRV